MKTTTPGITNSLPDEKMSSRKGKPFFFWFRIISERHGVLFFFLWIWNKKVSNAFTLQQHSNGKWTLWRCISYSRRVIIIHCHVSLPEGKALKQKHFGAETLFFRLIRFPFQVFWNNLCFSSSTSTSIIQAAWKRSAFQWYFFWFRARSTKISHKHLLTAVCNILWCFGTFFERIHSGKLT